MHSKNTLKQHLILFKYIYHFFLIHYNHVGGVKYGAKKEFTT